MTRTRVGPLRFDPLRADEVVDRVFGDLERRRGGWIVTANIDFLRRASRSRDLTELYCQADLVLADGAPVLWAARVRGEPLPERVAGSDLVTQLAERAGRDRHSLYLLGGADDSAARAAAVLRQRHPGIESVRFSSPWVSAHPTDGELEQIRKDVLLDPPSLLFVGFGSPKQEYVIDALRGDLPTTWMLGCGISFSFLAGDIARAPLWMQRWGLEWLHRLCQEPRRLARRYLWEDSPFAAWLLLESWASRNANRSRPARRS